MRVAVPAGGFASWGGGIDFLRAMLNGLLAAEGGCEVVLLLPRKSMTRTIRERLALVRRRVREGSWRTALAPGPLFASDHRRLSDSFSEYRDRVELAVYDESISGLSAATRRLRADVVMPSLGSLGLGFETPWVGYIYDFQHKYFPQFFGAAELRARDEWFHRVLSEAPVVVANARAVKDDAARFFPGLASRVVALPFSAAPRPEWFALPVDALRARYTRSPHYFLVSNQFWLHKDHETAFRAFHAYVARHEAGEVRLVCTGVMAEGRDPGYAGRLRRLVEALGIEDRVDFTGYVPKEHQIALMRGAIAVLQPTRFEGGPGGGAVWDAIAVGTPAIMSDIPVNLEIASEGVSCFRTGDPQDLADHMHRVRTQPPTRSSPDALVQAGRRRVHALGAALIECARTAIASRRRGTGRSATGG